MRILLTLTLIILLSTWIFLAKADDSSKILLTNPVPGSIVLMEQGYINIPSPDADPHVFTSTKACPSGLKAYFNITMSQVNPNQDGKDTISGYGVCVYDVTGAGPYTVRYLAVKRYGRISSTNAGDWISNKKGSFTVWDSIHPSSVKVSNTYTASFTGIGGFQWQMYCYNSAAGTPPPISTSCVPNIAPY